MASCQSLHQWWETLVMWELKSALGSLKLNSRLLSKPFVPFLALTGLLFWHLRNQSLSLFNLMTLQGPTGAADLAVMVDYITKKCATMQIGLCVWCKLSRRKQCWLTVTSAEGPWKLEAACVKEWIHRTGHLKSHIISLSTFSIDFPAWLFQKYFVFSATCCHSAARCAVEMYRIDQYLCHRCSK